MADNQKVTNGRPQDNLSFTLYRERCTVVSSLHDQGTQWLSHVSAPQ